MRLNIRAARLLTRLGGIVVLLQGVLPTGTVLAQVRSRVSVIVPANDVELFMNDVLVPTNGNMIRAFDSPALESGKEYDYTFIARWRPNGFTTVTRSTNVHFRAGDGIDVDLTKENLNERVRVKYVTTPDKVVTEMIALAKIGPTDVVFEPGCGDARITIAAVKAGAKRGVGIDIDQERVDDSRRNVSAAGLSDKIDIRLGDALDIRDLSNATVVFLYMSDEFGKLIEPILQRELKVGARIVSHRFRLGDWKPEKTIIIEDPWIPNQVHLWTITPEIKKRAAMR